MSAAEPWPPAAGGARSGTVSAFDDDRGLGTVVDDGGRQWPFHCTALTDGTRTTVPGTRVSFVPGPGHLGRPEARWVSPVR